jgi:hypothetical protein
MSRRGWIMRDLKLSSVVSLKVKAEDKECFINSVHGAVWLRANGHPEAKYVEGWATNCGMMAVMHGWVEVGDGTIVDPTPCWYKDDEYPEPEYFPVTRYDAQALSDAVSKIGVLPFCEEVDAHYGWDNPDYRRAYRACNRSLYPEDMADRMLDQLNSVYPLDEEVS